MKLVMTLVTRNEDDILPYNLEFHRKNGVDYFIVTNHKSEDNTYDILERYAKQGILEHRHETGEAFLQASWVTQMVRDAASTYRADWVINNDTDEFWCPLQGTLKEILQKKLDEGYGMLNVSRYDFFCRDMTNIPFFYTMIYREANRLWTKCTHVASEDVEVEEGNHYTHVKDLSSRGLESTSEIPELSILHFPVRSKEQFYRKMYTGTKAMLMDPTKGPGLFWHWKQALQDIEAGQLEQHYRRYCRDMAQIQYGLQAGQIVEDRRIEEALQLVSID